MGSLVLGYLVPIFWVSAYSLPPPGSNLFLSSHAAVKMPLLPLSLSHQCRPLCTELRGGAVSPSTLKSLLLHLPVGSRYIFVEQVNGPRSHS